VSSTAASMSLNPGQGRRATSHLPQDGPGTGKPRSDSQVDTTAAQRRRGRAGKSGNERMRDTDRRDGLLESQLGLPRLDLFSRYGTPRDRARCGLR
jgi:hypothetical protein